MKSPRQNPRINVRFPSLREMDSIEVAANRDGLELQEWIRQLVRDEMNDRPLRKLLFRSGFENLLIIRAMLEKLVSPDIIEEAKERAHRYMDQLEDHARDR